jgi:hypothetical protein
MRLNGRQNFTRDSSGIRNATPKLAISASSLSSCRIIRPFIRLVVLERTDARQKNDIRIVALVLCSELSQAYKKEGGLNQGKQEVARRKPKRRRPVSTPLATSCPGVPTSVCSMRPKRISSTGWSHTASRDWNVTSTAYGLLPSS